MRALLAIAGAGTMAQTACGGKARFVALWTAAWQGPQGSFNVLSRSARVASVSASGVPAVLDFAAPEGVQQLVFTAGEEPGIVCLLITQNGGLRAVIGGEGLVVDRPQTRRGLLGD